MVNPVLPGSEEGEPFQLVRLLGVGGFGHTYEARVLDEDLVEEFGVETVALKIPLSRKKERALARDIELLSVLHQRLKDLQATNLVRYLGFTIFRGQIVMAMQYVPGGSLRNRIGSIGRQRPMPVEETVRIGIGIAHGLEVIHRERIFHRDIKPENILMDGDVPKVTDFGLSRMLTSDELASTAAGSPFYRAPELLGHGASFPADIWSTGVTLYEMLTGRFPFGTAETPLGELIDLIRAATFVPVSELRGDVPPALEEIVDRALRKKPRDRFSAAEMAEALPHALAAQGGSHEELEAGRRLSASAEPSSDCEGRLCALVRRHPNEARAYQYLGEFYNRCLRYADAIEVLGHGLQVSPDDAVLHWDMALAWRQQGKREEARKHLERALALGLEARLAGPAKTLLKTLGAKA